MAFCPMKTGADQANQYSGRNRRRVCLSRPAYTFVLRPDLTIYKIYNGWFFVGRPQLRNCNLRANYGNRSDYRYEAYDMPEVLLNRGVGTPLGASGLPVARGVVRWFVSRAGLVPEMKAVRMSSSISLPFLAGLSHSSSWYAGEI